MFKKTLLFITTLLVALSTSTGYDSTDALKGSVQVTTFLDWFNHAHKYVQLKGLLVLDVIPALFLIMIAIMFFKEGKKVKALLSVVALLLNMIGVFLVMQYADPIATQMASWTPDNLPGDWISVKDEWIKYVGLNGLFGLVGWICFLVTFFIPARRNAALKPLPRFLNFSKNAILFFLTFSFGLSATRLIGFHLFPSVYDISGITFIELHRPLDIAIRKAGPYVFIFISILFAALATLFFVEGSKRKAWLAIGAYIFLLADTLIALQGNGPLNDLFLSWTPTTLPDNWSRFRDEWLQYHLYRDIFLFLMFTLLFIIHTSPDTKKSDPAN
jgi:hypothetical protein